MIRYKDNFLSQDILSLAKETTHAEELKAGWFDIDKIPNPWAKEMVNFAAEYYDFQEAVGIEVWYYDVIGHHFGTEWHYDFDHIQYFEHNNVHLPYCSIVLYINSDIIEGAKLLTKNSKGEIIELDPVENRCYLWHPRVVHKSDVGKVLRRTSYMINIWDKKIDCDFYNDPNRMTMIQRI